MDTKKVSQHLESSNPAWSDSRRDALAQGHIKGAFAGPNQSFPIHDGEDIRNAWNLAGHADSPDTVRQNIIHIAKRMNLTQFLPDTAK
jgi:hypothetical protein